MTTVTGRVAIGGLTAPRYTPADFAEPDRRSPVVRWAARAGALLAGRRRPSRAGVGSLTMGGPDTRR
ncbi:MAG: hypothetical protein ACFCVG_10310 [Kineosporiaceae bacterium]